MLTNLLIILLLLIMNGFFAMAELAIVSSRKARLRQYEDSHPKGTAWALDLAQDPTSFLSVVQIGVTLNSILAGAFSGATLAGPIGAFLDDYPMMAPYSDALSLILPVFAVSYFSLVIGELVPKRIGLAYAEGIAVRVSPIMRFFAWLTAPVVWVLRGSTGAVLKLMHIKEDGGTAVTEEEVKDMIAEGTESGIFHPAEKKMLEGVLRLADRTVRSIMTPRIDVAWLDIADPAEENARFMHESGYSRFPVAKGDLEEVVGIVHAKDLLNAVLEGREINVSEMLRPPFMVPDTTSVLRLIEQFKQSGQHVAIIIDEYGSVEGLVTVTDIIEAITGDMPEEGQESDEKPVHREDGSWLLDGMMPIDEVENLLTLKNMKEGGEFHTIAGFMIDRLGRIPAAGDVFFWNGAKFEVIDMDGRRVDKVLVYPPMKENESPSGAED